MAIWIVALALLVAALLRARRRSHQAPRRMRAVNAGLSLAMLLATLTAAELAFACFADFSDTFNISNVSKRWLALHIDAEKNQNGFRDRQELTTYVPGGKKRIIFLGDSFTAGHGIPRMEDRFTDLIAARFEREQPGKFVVANMALPRSEEHTSELQSHVNLVCRLLLEKKNKDILKPQQIRKTDEKTRE